jgi:hypothetical protein
MVRTLTRRPRPEQGSSRIEVAPYCWESDALVRALEGAGTPRHHCRLAREAFEAVERRSTIWARGRHRLVRIQSRINTVADILAYCFVVVISVWMLFLAIRGNQSREAKSRRIASEAYVIPVQD